MDLETKIGIVMLLIFLAGAVAGWYAGYTSRNKLINELQDKNEGLILLANEKRKHYRRDYKFIKVNDMENMTLGKVTSMLQDAGYSLHSDASTDQLLVFFKIVEIKEKNDTDKTNS